MVILHFALTRDVGILPDKFDDFNGALGVVPPSPELKPEMFADVTAFALLGDERLVGHLPKGFDKDMLPYFERYIKYVTATEWKRRKAAHEPNG